MTEGEQTPEAIEEQKKITLEVKAVKKELQKWLDKNLDAIATAETATEENLAPIHAKIAALNKEYQSLMQRHHELEPKREAAGFVWLFQQK